MAADSRAFLLFCLKRGYSFRMTITDKAKELFLLTASRLHKGAVRLSFELVDEQKRLHIELIPSKDVKRALISNGVLVDVSEEDQAALKNFVFDADGNHLLVSIVDPSEKGHCCHCCHKHE